MKSMSIIVPVYNVEAYLSDCLNSLCEQNLADIQVICVDDASTDSSWDILETYANQYQFLEIFKNHERKGLAYTRNAGLKHACGKYIMYVDSDDYLAPDCLGMVCEKLQKDNLDILFFDMWEFEDENNKSDDRRIRSNDYASMPGFQLLGALVKNEEMFGSVCGAAYRREYLEGQKAEFINGILHEDIAYLFSVALNAERAGVLNEVVYCYRQRSDSILHKPNYEKLLHGLTVTYASMLLTWNAFLHRKGGGEHIDEHESTYLQIYKYIDSVVSLMRGRYFHISEHGKTDMVTRNFFDNFSFNTEKILQAHFKAEDAERIKKSEKVLVYGAGNIAKEVVEVLMKLAIRIDGIYVTNTSENECCIYNIPVEAYTNISFSEKNQCMIIAVSENRQREIVKLLQENNFKGSVIKVK